ncbi:MAG: sialate O-acetylesterase, partial [Planctomycetaceae bacterium]|nr:sialate O-acetylesterase [Planctomycetaceae bacterium]
MRSITFCVAGCVLLLSVLPCLAADEHPMDLYLLIGQSNMAGRGAVEDQDREVLPRVMMLNQAEEWVPAVDPLHFDKPVAGVGVGRTFGRLMAEASPDVIVGLIPCAVGGSPIDSWQPGEFYPPTKSHPWDDALRRAKAAMTKGTLKGILWHQGESDSNAELAPGYQEKLHDLIGRLRTELAAPDVPFIAGQMGQFSERPWSEAKQLVDQAHRTLPEHVAQTAFVNSDGLQHKGDEIHFDSASYRELGRRYAEAMLQLQVGQVAQGQFLQPQLSSYAIVVSQHTAADQGWSQVIAALQVKYPNAAIVTWQEHVDESLADLQKLHPRFTCFVCRPEEAGRELVVSVHRLTRRLDEDP